MLACAACYFSLMAIGIHPDPVTPPDILKLWTKADAAEIASSLDQAHTQDLIDSNDNSRLTQHGEKALRKSGLDMSDLLRRVMAPAKERLLGAMIDAVNKMDAPTQARLAKSLEDDTPPPVTRAPRPH
jgi:hypothetical protein